MVEQRLRLRIFVDEDQAAEKLAAHGHQRPAGKVQIHEIALVANGGELAVQRVAPAMIAADEAPCFAGQFGDQRCAAMLTGVVESADLALQIAHHQYGRSCVAGEEPRSEEHTSELQSQ